MMMKFSLVPTILFLATTLVCSAAQTTDVEAKLTDVSEIMNNGWIKLTCDTEKVRLSSRAGVAQLEPRRKLSGSSSEEKIASYNASADPNSRLSIGAKYKDNKSWTIKGYGDDPKGKPDSLYMTAMVNKTQCSDAGDYYCLVTYTDDKSGQEQTIKGHMYLPSIAEITKINLTGITPDGRDIFKNKILEHEIIVLDCYVKGPKLLKLTWQKDEKVIGDGISPPEVQKVVHHDPKLLTKVGGCPQYQYQESVVLKAERKVHYQCVWNYKSRTDEVNFDMGSIAIDWSDYDSDNTDTDIDVHFNYWNVIGPALGIVGALALLTVGVFLWRRNAK